MLLKVHSLLLHELERHPSGTKIRFLEFSSDGVHLAAAGEPLFTLALFSLGMLVSSLNVNTAGDTPSISVFDVNSRRRIFLHSLPASEHSLAVVWLAKTPSRPKHLAHLSSNSMLCVFNPGRKESRSVQLEAHTPALRSKGCLASATDGFLLATSLGPEFKLWDVGTRGMEYYIVLVHGTDRQSRLQLRQ
jgi:WD40 repeat protein